MILSTQILIFNIYMRGKDQEKLTNHRAISHHVERPFLIKGEDGFGIKSNRNVVDPVLVVPYG